MDHVHGHVTSGWEDIRSAFKQNLDDGLDIGASLCIYYRGNCVVDLTSGWKDPETKKEPYTSDTLQLVFSTSKGIISAAIALCVERQLLDYNAPVARYWPEFAANGKQNITISELLAHRAGIACVDEDNLTVEDGCNWSRMVSLIAAQKPHWEPGTAHGYHAHTLGYAAGELIHRVDPQHRSYGQFVRDELDSEFYVGIPNDDIEARISPVVRKPGDTTNVRPKVSQTDKALSLSGAFPLNSPYIVFNEPRVHRAELPGANGITNARSLARIYSLLIGDINENGIKQKRLISEKTLQEAIENVTPADEPDLSWYNKPSTFSKGGFQIYGECFQIFREGVFGFSGYGGSCAFAFPPHQLTYAYACNHLDPGALTIDPRNARVIQAIEKILNDQNI
ncbi:unnamed protein product [Adineta steineri]|uniref:Beta-lactamase-related domain-containing protein n=1 Tax=Adineta steineri TaxID=433720 RepID=A0A818ZBT6_9BILA|nr:unnamed protein product [Adineta steineri]CAF3762662.1 unnamed protein product [Adineta steineri]